MSSNDSALHAIRTQVQFELMQAAASVAQAAEITAGAQEKIRMLRFRCQAFRQKLHELVAQPRLNVALLGATRRCLRIEHLELNEWQKSLVTAQRREQEAHSALAALRNRERSLDRAQEVELRRRQQQRETIEMARVDELWLQHSLRDVR